MPRRTKWRAVLRPILRVDLMANAKVIDDPVSGHDGGPVGLRLGAPDDFSRLATLAESDSQGIPDFPSGVSLVEEFERRHHKGDVCLLAEVDDRIVYFSWMCFDAATLPGYGIFSPLLPGEAYVNMTYTLSAYRGQGVATAAGLERHRWLRDHGIRRAYSWTRVENRAALKVRDRAGWRAVGRLTQFYWRIRRRYALLTVTTSDPADPLAAWCGPDRLRVNGGIRIAWNKAAWSG